jgi:hypothetical protein
MSGQDRLKRLQRRLYGLALDVQRLSDESQKVTEMLLMAIAYVRDELTSALEQDAREREPKR